MNILNKLKNKATKRLSPKAAMYLSAVAMLGADCEVDDEDMDLIFEFRDQQHISSDDEKAALEYYDASQDFLDSVQKSAQSLNAKQRVYLLCCLISMLASKERLSAQEQGAWSAIAEIFGVDPVLTEGIDSAVSVLSGIVTFNECSS